MRKTIFLLLFSVLLVFNLLQGCSKDIPKKVEKNPYSKVDGQLISYSRLNDKNIDSSLNLYEMVYWSKKTKTLAYAAIPEATGNQVSSLMIECHGGFLEPVSETHVENIGDVYFDKRIAEDSYPNEVTLIPLYRGYGESNGKVRGVYENTMDTQNAIKALKTFLKKKNITLFNNEVGLQGTSMGGAVALKLASERKDIDNTVLISPAVGLNIMMPWLKKHNDGGVFSGIYSEIEQGFGVSFDPKKNVYRRESIDYKKINTPVFIIQGTQDQSAPLETVKVFYQQMKDDGKDITLKQVVGGNHALANKNEVLKESLSRWYDQHRLP